MKKPAEPTRTTIRPSDLTFGLSTCHRCLWLFYWFKLDMPKIMPLVSPLSAMQEKAFRGMNLQDLDPSLPKGVVSRFGQKVKSENFVINGENSRMGLGASQKANMDHARQFDVVAVACLPLHQPLGAHARHCSADALVRVQGSQLSAIHCGPFAKFERHPSPH